MNKQIPLKELEPLIRETLKKGGTFPIIPKGQSMLPLLRPGVDEVLLSPLPEEVLKGDIILYKREDGSFVLHRVMGKKGALYTFCGDNQTVFEKGLKKEQMIAIVLEITRDGEKINLTENKEYLSYKKKLLNKKKLDNFLLRVKIKIKKALKL